MIKSISELLPYRLRPLIYTNELFLLEGLEKHSSLPLTILIAADSGIKDYIKTYGFDLGVREQSLGRIPMWLTPKTIRWFFRTADLVLWLADPILDRYWPRPKPHARLPTWTRLDIDLQSPDSIKRGEKKVKRYRNATIKSGYTIEHTKCEFDYIDFIDNMHLPYIKKRHGENALFVIRERLFKDLQLKQKRLFILKSEGRSIGGSVLEYNDFMDRFWHIGIRPNLSTDVSAGVCAALYCFVINNAKERGSKILHLGYCRPFVRDGVFEYKRQFGGHSVGRDPEDYGSIELTIFCKSAGAVRFLTENPMIALRPNKKYALYIFTEGASDEEIEKINTLKDRYCFRENLELYAFDLSTHDNHCWYTSN
jgi:hypothetical protein